MSAPRVSVVLPTRNRVAFLQRAIASVLAQTESDLELIIVDDASTDGTPECLAAAAFTDRRIRIVTNATAMGGGGARNAGVDVSRGAWIAFLDDDDLWVADKLAIQLEKLADNPAAVACSCSYVHRFSIGSSRTIRLPERVTLAEVLRTNVLGGASMCVCSRDVLRAIGAFDVEFRSGQDWDLWVRLLQAGPVVVCREALVRYQAHDAGQISTNMRAQHLGARRFYFKYRHLMDDALRQHHLAFACFIMSRQSTRPVTARMRYLGIAVRHVAPQLALAYAVSSLPRMIRDVTRRMVTGGVSHVT